MIFAMLNAADINAQPVTLPVYPLKFAPVQAKIRIKGATVYEHRLSILLFSELGSSEQIYRIYHINPHQQASLVTIRQKTHET